MSTARLEKILYWVVRIAAYALPFTVFVVIDSLFFPFITGKNFLFRIIIEVMAAGWIGLLIINFRKYWPRWNFVSVAITLFVAAIFISSVFGVDFNHSFWSNFERMEGVITYLHLLLLFFVFAGVFRTRREWFVLFGFSIVASVLVALWGLLEYTGVVVSVADSSRIISTLGNPLYVAAYLSFHIFLMAFLSFQTRNSFLKWILWGALLFELAIFFLTAARGAFVGMIVGLGIILILQVFFSRGVKKKFFFLGIIIALLSVPVLLNVFRDADFIQGNDALSRFSYITLEAGQARFTLWGMAIESFKERPILGWGVGNFGVPYAKNYDPDMFGQEAWFDRTHNMPLEWLVAGGIVTFLAYLALLTSILWALKKGVGSGILDKRSAFIFVGMFAAYLVQLLFVFDTMSTYLMLIVFLGFFYAVSSTNKDIWSRKNTQVLSFSDIPSGLTNKEKFSKKKQKGESATNKNTPITSAIRTFGVVVVFVAAGFLIVFINIRPWMANAMFMNALVSFSEGKAEETKEQVEEALLLAKGTIGAPEFREHLAINVYRLSEQPETLKSPEVGDLYKFSVQEMEKQVQENSQEYLKIKHNILLAQLYSMLAVLVGNREALDLSINQYDAAVRFAPNYVNVYPVMANTLARSGSVNEAASLIEKAEGLLLGVDKYDERIFYSKPLFYTAAGRYDDAYEALKEIKKIEEYRREEFEKLGQLSEEEKNKGYLEPRMIENIVFATRSHGAGAAPFLEKLHFLDKGLTSASLMLAQLNAASGSKELARFYATEALKNDSSIKGRVDEFLTALEATTSSPDGPEE